MGRDDHNSSSNNKNSLPQTPKTQKMNPNPNPNSRTSTTRKEEFSREFTEIINKTLKQGTAKSTEASNRLNKR